MPSHTTYAACLLCAILGLWTGIWISSPHEPDRKDQLAWLEHSR